MMAQALLRDALTHASPIQALKRPATIEHRYAVKIPIRILISRSIRLPSERVKATKTAERCCRRVSRAN